MTVSTRSGGHSYIGGCLGEGIVLDVSPLSSIAFQSKTNRVEVGAGTRLGPLYSSLYCDHGQRTLTSGTCLSIGISGITLGGGYNSQSRLSGLTIDSLRSAEVVLADGSLVRADATRETDLFWAIRGGGPSFGVVTALEFETQPWQQFSTVTMTWPWGSSATAFSIWSEWIAGLSMSSTRVRSLNYARVWRRWHRNWRTIEQQFALRRWVGHVGWRELDQDRDRSARGSSAHCPRRRRIHSLACLWRCARPQSLQRDGVSASQRAHVDTTHIGLEQQRINTPRAGEHCMGH